MKTSMAMAMAAAGAVLLALAACGGAGGGDAENQAGNETGDQAAVANEAAGADEANSTSGGKDAANGTETAQEAAPASSPSDGPSATASSPSAEIRALLIGRWTEGEGCDAATDIRQDGTYSSAAGQGRWTLESEYLTLTGDGAPIELAVQEIDRSAMITINPMGRIGRWRRC
jgi:hypothetical protein